MDLRQQSQPKNSGRDKANALPRDGDKLVEFIKRFVNLNTALFTRGCKLCKLLKELVDVLEEMPENVREAMSQQMMAAIMWIVQLQARHFYKRETDVREDFTRMLKDLKANIPNICHASLPYALYEVKIPKGKSKATEEEKKEEEEEPESPKRRRVMDNSNAHPLLVEKIVPVMNSHNLTLGNMTNYAKCTFRQLFGTTVCGYSCLGLCKNKSCRMKHEKLSDDKAKRIIDMLKPALEEPDKIGKK